MFFLSREICLDS